jgi:hypothetical protein
MRDRSFQVGMPEVLELEVTLQNLLHVFADHELAETLQVREPFEEQDALDERVGMLHFVDRLVVLVLAELVEPPVLQHAGVQEVLVDRSEFVLEDVVEVRNDFDVALHGAHSAGRLRRASGRESRSLMGRRGGIKFPFVEHFARTRFAGPAARGNAGTGLQLLERTRALANRLFQALLGDAVAETNVHFVTTSA